MSPPLSDAEFARAHERYYLHSVRAAVEETYRWAAWKPEHEVAEVLTKALVRRGISVDEEAIHEGASVISRGRKPFILQPESLQPGTGRRRL